MCVHTGVVTHTHTQSLFSEGAGLTDPEDFDNTIL